jgi:hypothetical protein
MRTTAELWSLVSDVRLMPTLSNELQSVEWVDGATGPRVGARFVGHNEHDAFGQWSSASQIVACDVPSEFAWAVGDFENPSATWRFRLTPRDGGTTLSFWMRMGRAIAGVRGRDGQDARGDQEACRTRGALTRTGTARLGDSVRARRRFRYLHEFHLGPRRHAVGEEPPEGEVATRIAQRRQ